MRALTLGYVEVPHDGSQRECWCGADIPPFQVSVHRHTSGEVSCSQSCAIELDAVERRVADEGEGYALVKELAS